MTGQKKTILLDIDGVLNFYNGEYIENFIPPIRPDAKDFLDKLSKTCKIKLFTSRDINLAEKWVKENNIQKYIKEITNTKEPAWLIIDDRCISFNGNFDDLNKNIESFKVWYK